LHVRVLFRLSVNERRPIREVLIVGGGTAGWMTATHLATEFRSTGRRVTLIESSNVPIIGVGEATVPSLVGYLRVLGIDEREFIRRCHATYKLGIKFINWQRGEDSFWHPFGPAGGHIDDVQLFHFWLKSLHAGHAEQAYSSYSAQALLGDLEKSPGPLTGSSMILDQGQYAYHLDAGAFAEFLKSIAVERGAKHIVDDVTGCELDQHGHIGGISTRATGTLKADLYIDCSGFKALLAEGTLGDPYVDWSDILLCDRALAAPLPGSDSMPPYTRSTALSAGWAWQIPLSHRVGNGYVYCSSFIDEASAARELANLLRVDPANFTPRSISMRIGHRRNFWRGNCIAIGLAAGFVEPLESTGLFLIQRGLGLLMDYFPDCGCDSKLSERYNRRMTDAYNEVRDFILLHYVLSQRADSPFWIQYRNIALPDSLRETLELYDRTGLVEPVRHALFQDSSWYSILSGQHRLPRAYHRRADLSDFSKVRHIMSVIKNNNQQLAQPLPSHRTYIEHINGATH
jgi:tryptophan halogenase